MVKPSLNCKRNYRLKQKSYDTCLLQQRKTVRYLNDVLENNKDFLCVFFLIIAKLFFQFVQARKILFGFIVHSNYYSFHLMFMAWIIIVNFIICQITWSSVDCTLYRIPSTVFLAAFQLCLNMNGGIGSTL